MKTAVTLIVENPVFLLMLIETNRTLLVKHCQYIVFMHSNMNMIIVNLLNCRTLILTIVNRASVSDQNTALHVSSSSKCQALHNTGWPAEFS